MIINPKILKFPNFEIQKKKVVIKHKISHHAYVRLKRKSKQQDMAIIQLSETEIQEIQ